MLALKEICHSLPLKIATAPAWAQIAVGDLDAFLTDHASCERKAHAAAMMLVNKYPEYPKLQDNMITLALEELAHFQQVVNILRSRGLTLGADAVDPYVKALLTQVRHGRDTHLLDRLMVVAVVEARSCERFCLLAEALPKSDLKDFYTNFAIEESAHFPLLMRTAKLYFPSQEVEDTLDALLNFETALLPSLPLRPAVH
jgi:tRNA-(ms[2]io[6]A)-hydroxylase